MPKLRENAAFLSTKSVLHFFSKFVNQIFHQIVPNDRYLTFGKGDGFKFFKEKSCDDQNGGKGSFLGPSEIL